VQQETDVCHGVTLENVDLKDILTKSKLQAQNIVDHHMSLNPK